VLLLKTSPPTPESPLAQHVSKVLSLVVQVQDEKEHHSQDSLLDGYSPCLLPSCGPKAELIIIKTK
jgi:hypothetical protein